MPRPAGQVLPGGQLRGRQPPARPEQRSVQADAGPLQRAHLRPPRLPGLRRGARRPLRARRRDARHRRPAGRRQRHRLPRGLLDAVSPRRPGRCRGSTRCSATPPRSRPASPRRCGSRAATTCAWSARAATAAPSTSASVPVRHVRAQRRRALHLLRQRGLHEHRRAALRAPRRRPRAPRPRRPSATSPATPFGQGKNVPLIAMAHEIPYVATATVADLRDLEPRSSTRWSMHGARYLHVLVPCPLGWGSRLARHDPDRAAGQGDRAVPGVRGRARRGDRASSKIRRRCRSRTTCGRRSATRTCSSRARPRRRHRRHPGARPTATSSASACSTRR